jgi:Spy/CpxP family protein refolding chaperone
MDENRIAKRVAVAVAFLFLGATPGLTREQSAPSSSAPQSAAPAPVPTAPHAATPGVRPKREATPEDDFAGLTYTDEQKAKIDKINETAKMRADAIIRDEKLNLDQKQAMLAGYRRMKIDEMFKLLTPEQQAEVLKKASARRKALVEEQKQLKEQQQKRRQQKPPLPPE